MAHRTLASGTLLASRYRIERLIKAGGFAAVYVAVDQRQRKRCAVKETFDQSQDGAEQFRLEADILAGVRHPNLPGVWDYFQDGGGLYLVMEFIEGDDLESKLEVDGSLPETPVRTWTIQLCEAITALHTHEPPIIHRDIKPANVKITPDGRAVLVDFGIAKLYRVGNNTQIAARAVTDGFSPLEQYGQGSTDARSDVYALGATLYNLLTGVIPPDAPTRVAEESLVPPTRFQPNISPMMERIILKALHVRPNDRFQTADEMHRALLAMDRQPAYSQGRGTGGLAPTGTLSSRGEVPAGTWWCATCQARNQQGNSFCLQCGAAAPTIEVEQPTRIITPIASTPTTDLNPSPYPPALPVPATPSGASARLAPSGAVARVATTDRAWEAMAGPAGGVLLTIAGRPGQGLVACGERGLVLAHNGESWMPLPTATSYTLYAAAVAPGHIWCTGEYGTVVHFTNGRWSVLQGDVEETLGAISLDSPISGWIAGSSGTLVDLRDLTLEPLPVRRGQIRSIAIDDVGDGWAVGDHSLLLRLTNGTWKPRTSADGWSDLRCVALRDSHEAWAVGANGTLLRLDDAGWQVITDLHLPLLSSIAFNRRGEGWAVGEQGALVWFNGDRWSLPAVPCPMPVTLRSVAWLHDDEAWAIGDHGVVMRWRR